MNRTFDEWKSLEYENIGEDLHIFYQALTDVLELYKENEKLRKQVEHYKRLWRDDHISAFSN